MTVLISIFGPPRSYYQPCRAIFQENCSTWLISLLAGQIIEIIQPWLIKRNLPSHVRMDFVDLDFKWSTVCPTLLGLIGIWQKWLGFWAR